MSPKVTLFHNPRCSKSRQALALLRERRAELEVIEYLKAPPSKAEIRRLIKRLSISPQDVLRRKESAYREAGLSPKSSTETIIGAIHAHPILLERPIAIQGDRAVIGRPPERVLDLL